MQDGDREVFPLDHRSFLITTAFFGGATVLIIVLIATGTVTSDSTNRYGRYLARLWWFYIAAGGGMAIWQASIWLSGPVEVTDTHLRNPFAMAGSQTVPWDEVATVTHSPGLGGSLTIRLRSGARQKLRLGLVKDAEELMEAISRRSGRSSGEEPDLAR